VDLLEVGDLVEVKKSNDLSPTLRFFHNKRGMIVRLVTESLRGNDTFMREWEILFTHGKRAVFKDYELVLISKADEGKK
jgi:hypothetical protein